MTARALALGLAALLGCASEPVDVTTTLSPPPNPMPESDPLWTPQPHRERPRAICVDPAGKKGWVLLAGTEDDPGTDVVVVDL